MVRRLALAVLALTLGLLVPRPAPAAEPYAGPLIDAHSHLPNLQVLEALIAAMDRHQIARVALLGVGGVQKDDQAWIETTARRFPDRVIPFAPVPDPTAADAAKRLDALLATGRFKGETLDRLMRWTRRVLGELPPDVAERIAHTNAERLFRLK